MECMIIPYSLVGAMRVRQLPCCNGRDVPSVAVTMLGLIAAEEQTILGEVSNAGAMHRVHPALGHFSIVCLRPARGPRGIAFEFELCWQGYMHDHAWS